MRSYVIVALLSVFVFACGGEEQADTVRRPVVESGSPASVRAQVETRCRNSQSDSFCTQAYALIDKWASGEITDDEFVSRILELQNPAPEPSPSGSSGEDGRYEGSDSDPACASLELKEVESSESLHLELWDSDTDERTGGLNFIRIEDGTSYNDLKGYACYSLGFQHRLNAADSAVFNLFSYGDLPVQCEYNFDTHRGPFNYPCISYGGRSNSGVVHSECRDDIREPLLDPDFAFLAYIENGEFHLEDCRRGGKEDCVRTVDRIWPPVPGEKGSCPENNEPDPIWLRPHPPVNVRIQSEAIPVPPEYQTQGNRDNVGRHAPTYDGFTEKITVSWELGEGADYTILDISRHGEYLEGGNTVRDEREVTVLARDSDQMQFFFMGYSGSEEDVGKDYRDVDGVAGGGRTLYLQYTARNHYTNSKGKVTGFVENCYKNLFFDNDPHNRDCPRETLRPFPEVEEK